MSLPFPNSRKPDKEIKTYMVALKPPERLPDFRTHGRRVLVEKMSAYVQQNVKKIKKLIERDNLQDEVESIVPMQAVGVITIRCTDKVAAQIRKLPNVVGVAEDKPIQIQPMQPDDPHFPPGNNPPTFYC